MKVGDKIGDYTVTLVGTKLVKGLFAEPPRDLRTETAEVWAGKVAAETDDIIRAGLNRKLGTDWTLADIAKRCSSLRYQGDSYETLAIDGEPFLELHDVEFPPPGEFKPGEPYIITATRNYRFLGKAVAK